MTVPVQSGGFAIGRLYRGRPGKHCPFRLGYIGEGREIYSGTLIIPFDNYKHILYFVKPMYEENRIIKDARVLKEEFIPSRVLHREGQLDAIRNCLKPTLKEMEPRNIFIFGSPGTGKTCISRYVAEELSAVLCTQGDGRLAR